VTVQASSGRVSGAEGEDGRTETEQHHDKADPPAGVGKRGQGHHHDQANDQGGPATGRRIERDRQARQGHAHPNRRPEDGGQEEEEGQYRHGHHGSEDDRTHQVAETNQACPDGHHHRDQEDEEDQDGIRDQADDASAQ
jgi:hypothetical protein